MFTKSLVTTPNDFRMKTSLVANKRRELKRLIRFREHITVLVSSVELPADYVTRLIENINDRIADCEEQIRAGEDTDIEQSEPLLH